MQSVEFSPWNCPCRQRHGLVGSCMSKARVTSRALAASKVRRGRDQSPNTALAPSKHGAYCNTLFPLKIGYDWVSDTYFRQILT
jgi:hypothetical protein